MATTAPPTYPPGYLEESRAGEVFRTTIAFIILDTVATILRTYARRLTRSGFMWADVFMPVSLLFNLGTCTCALLAVRWGVGRHAAAVDPENFKPFVILSYYGIGPVYLGAITFSKLAILDLYLHVFTDKFSRYTSYLCGTVTILCAVVNFITLMTQCHPISYLWNPVPGGGCNNVRIHFTWASFPNIITDLVMLILPIPVILKIQTKWQKKTGIVLTFLVGSIGLITSVFRFAEFYIFSWNYEKSGWTATNSDATWTDAINIVWTVVEPGVYHLAACMITFRPLARWLVYDSPFAPMLARTFLVTTRAGSVAGVQGEPIKLSGGSSSNSISGQSGRPDYFVPVRNYNRSQVGTEEARWAEDVEGQITVKHNIRVTESHS